MVTGNKSLNIDICLEIAKPKQIFKMFGQQNNGR